MIYHKWPVRKARERVTQEQPYGVYIKWTLYAIINQYSTEYNKHVIEWGLYCFIPCFYLNYLSVKPIYWNVFCYPPNTETRFHTSVTSNSIKLIYVSIEISFINSWMKEIYNRFPFVFSRSASKRPFATYCRTQQFLLRIYHFVLSISYVPFRTTKILILFVRWIVKPSRTRVKLGFSIFIFSELETVKSICF